MARFITFILLLAFSAIPSSAQREIRPIGAPSADSVRSGPTSPIMLGIGVGIGSADYDGMRLIASPYLAGYYTPFKWGGFGARLGFDMYTKDADDPRYAFDDSADRCKDTRSGQFARSELCDGETAIAPLIEAEALFEVARLDYDRVFLISGIRLHPSLTPYVGARYMLFEGMIEMGARAGPSFLFVGFSFRFASVEP